MITPLTGTVVAVAAAVGEVIAAGRVIVVVEAMKMEHPITASEDVVVDRVLVAVGDVVEVGQIVAVVTSSAAVASVMSLQPDGAGDAERQDLAEVRRRRALLLDAARPDAVAKRRDRGQRTARENIDDLCDPGTFVEYGGLAIAAQRGRRSVADLQANTPADGLVTGIGEVGGQQVAIAAYDATVLAGTQGAVNHHKKDRIFRLARELSLPFVLFAEGGGGRPGDVDVVGASYLEAEAFLLFAALSGRVPTIAVVAGRCFAGNAALAGCADVIVATANANLGLAGPAMIEGGGLGTVTPEQIGPMDVQGSNGVVDVVVRDEAEAVDVCRRYLAITSGASSVEVEVADQALLRDVVPENRKRVYEIRTAIDLLADVGSTLELRVGFAPGMITTLARLDGRAVGILANDPGHLGGAIDADGSDKAARFLQLCDAHALPVIVLCDTPGFMVGVEAEGEATVRHGSRLFVVAANLDVPVVAVILRKAYGLGAQAMFGGHLNVPVVTLAWPTAELGPMGLEGAVRLGFSKELEATADPDEREQLEEAMIALAHANAAGLNVASFGEIDDVIDPADTRSRVVAALRATDGRSRDGSHRFVDPW